MRNKSSGFLHHSFGFFCCFVVLFSLSAFLYPSDAYAAKFSIGDKVEVYNTGGSGLRLRSCASTSCSSQVTMPDGTQMTVWDGPYQSDGYTWWGLSGYVNSSFYLGYSAEDYLKKVSSSCSYSLSQTSQSVGSSGGTYSVSVYTSSGCSWTATSNTSWITITSGSSGSGNGTVSYSVSTNTSSSSRTGTMSIAGQTLTVTQEGEVISCTDSYEPNDSSSTAYGYLSSGSSYSGGKICTSSDVDWFKVNITSAGTISLSLTVPSSNDYYVELYGPSYSWVAGNHDVSISYNATTTGTYYIRVLGYNGSYNTTSSYTLTYGSSPCSYSLLQTSQSVGSSGGTYNVSVYTSSGCSWTATSNNTSWITITSGSSGSGNGTVSYSVSTNTSSSSRTGTMSIAGQTYTVTQEGEVISCTDSYEPNDSSSASYGYLSSGSSYSGKICTSSDVDWFKVNITSAGTISLSLTVPSSNDYYVELYGPSYSWVAGNHDVSISYNATTTGTYYIRVLGYNGSLNETSSYTLAYTFTTTTCSYSLSQTSQSVGSSGGTYNVSVYTSSGCSWTATSNNTSWITITSGSSGSGNGTVSYSVSTNTSSSSRTGTMSIAGQTLTVTQEGEVISCPDSYEPNDSSSTAYGYLSSGSSYSGGKICTSSDVDWFKVNITSAGTISLSLTVPSSNDYYVELYSPSYLWVAGNHDVSISYNATTTGTYYIRVLGYNGSYNTTNSYTLAYNFTNSDIPPTVTTKAATNVTSSSATLNGTVNANGLLTTAWFEYGKSSGSYSSKSSTQSISGTSDTAVSSSVSGLSAGTTYYYKLVAQNSAGTTYGTEMTFTTTKVNGSPTVTNKAATNVTFSSATLNGTVNANGLSTTVTFKYGKTSGSFDSLTTVQSVSGTSDTTVSGSISGLSAGTTYYYTLVANNSAGYTTGSEMSFTTMHYDGPPVVTTKAATNVTSSSATLNGTVNANGLSTYASFKYGKTSGSSDGITTIKSISGSSDTEVSSSISGLSSGTTYYYSLAAGSTLGNEMTFTTQTSAKSPIVTTGSATNVTSSSATLNGTVNANGLLTTGWFEYGKSSGSYSSKSSTQSISGTSNTAVSSSITGLSAGTTYYYKLVAQNSAGTTYGTEMTFTTTKVNGSPTVTTKAATNVTFSSATLNGTVNANGLSTTVTFKYGKTSGSFDSLTTVQSVSGTSDTAVSSSISGLSAGTTYYYTLVANNSAGYTTGSEMSFTTMHYDGPPVVTTKAATNVTSSSATLNGTVNANGLSTTGWFEYGKSSGSYSSKTSTQSISGTSNTTINIGISGLSAGTTYYYRLVAKNSAGTTYGTEMSFTTTAVGGTPPTVTTKAATNVTSSSATLNGTVNANGLSTTAWFEYGKSSGSYSSKSSTQSISGSSDTKISSNFVGLSSNTTYYYRIAASNSAGTSYGNEVSFSQLKVTFLDKEDSTREVEGFAADGVSKVTIQINNLPESTTTKDVKTSINDGDGYLDNDKQISNGVFTQTYIAPGFFVRKGHEKEDISRGERDITGTVSVNGQKVEYAPFYLIKPPVVLLHGIWSDSSTWGTLTTRLHNDYGYEYRYLINESYPNAVSFDQNKSVIGNRIDTALNYTKFYHIVAKKVDVVAHSMGGIITKLYGNESKINSITTVGTPHFGSPWADLLWPCVDDADSSNIEYLVAELVEKIPYMGSATKGAIKDLRTTLHVEANQIDVPLCVIVGVAPVEDQNSRVFVVLLKTALSFKIPALREFDLLEVNKLLFNGEANDWLVSKSSQKGGYGSAVDEDVTWHPAETTDEEVLQKIINYLHRTSNTTSTSLMASVDKNAFNTQSEEPKSKDTNTLLSALSNMKMGVSSGQVQITYPNKGQVFYAGDTVNVEVCVSNEKATVLIATSTGESILIEQSPYNFQFVIPDEVIGSLNILAGARDDAGYIGLDDVTINVATTSNLTDIKVYPETSPVYLTVGAKLPLNIYGLYVDNIERKITSSSSGISYTSSNPDVAEVSTEGLITAKSKGEAVITIEHCGVKKEITIIGKSEPDISCSPDPYNFGSASVGGTSETKKFTVKNMGNADLVIDTISITGADVSAFRIQNDNCSGRTVTASEGCTIEIVFTPTSGGTKSAYLSIPSNDPGTKNLIIRLTGTPSECDGKAKTVETDTGDFELLIPESKVVLVTVTDAGGCPVANEKVSAKVNVAGKKCIEISTSSKTTDENGEAAFTITAKKETDNATVTFKSVGIKKKITANIVSE